MPQYDYLYLGDNARAPYGNRSFETVYQYTLECVKQLFRMNCHLVVLACNTASAKALRTIQQKDLPLIAPHKRVLGVIRPTTEIVGNYTKTGHVGILGTSGTILSDSYSIEIRKFFPHIQVHQQACPMWVPLIENSEYDSPGADYFVHQYIALLLQQAPDIDVIILACTHYPLLTKKIKQFLPPHITLLSQGEIVARSLQDYLSRHPEIEQQCSKNSQGLFYTTDSPEIFNKQAEVFFGASIEAAHLDL